MKILRVAYWTYGAVIRISYLLTFILIMNNWYTEFEKDIVQKLNGVKDRDLRFFRIEEYLRIVRRVDTFAPTCRECSTFRFEIERQKDSIDHAVNIPGRERREFDRLQSKMIAHMKKHGFYPPYYFTYLHSLIWMIVLMGIAFLISLFFPETDIFLFLTPSFAIGVIAGQIVGGKKDRRIRSANKIL